VVNEQGYLDRLTTFGHGLAACYRLQEWEKAMEGKATPGAYGANFLVNTQACSGNLRGLQNEDICNALGILASQRCVAYQCEALVNLAHTEGDHIIPVEYGGSEALRNRLPLCQRHNSSKLTKDLLQWWLVKAWPVAALSRAILCHYCRSHWQQWHAQVHREPMRDWMRAFLDQRAALLPSPAHRTALVQAALQICEEAQQPATPPPGPYLPHFGSIKYNGPLKS
jgi:hypothetical protein